MSNDRLNGLKRYLVGTAIAVTTALLMQTGALIWWTSAINTRVNYIERDVTRVSDRVYALEVNEQ